MSIYERLEGGIDTGSPEETMRLAAEFAEACPPDVTLKLSGDLGAGKTVFVKGLARAWGISETVTSPTFNIFSVYRGLRTLVHMDAYRLDSPAQMDALMVEDFLRSPYCLAVEWPEKVAGWLPAEAWSLTFQIGSDRKHHLHLLRG